MLLTLLVVGVRMRGATPLAAFAGGEATLMSFPEGGRSDDLDRHVSFESPVVENCQTGMIAS
jgi:hypothetical protein